MFENSPPTRRLARIAFGLVLIAGAAVLFHVHRGQGPFEAPGRAEYLEDGTFVRHPPVHAWLILLATWLGAIVAATHVHVLCEPIWARSSANPDKWRVASFVIPAIGLALVLPLTLHMPFALLLGGTADGFDAWCTMSIWMVGIAHLVFAALVAYRVYRIATGRLASDSTASIWVLTIFASMFPFVIPAAFVAVTLAPLTFILRHMERWIAADPPQQLARAIVVV